MAEFQEVCKHLKRMCERYGDNCIKCPLGDKDYCSLSAGDRTAETYKKAEEIIMTLAAEHPEPVYPTWGEWLMSIGVISGLFPKGAIDALGNLKQPIPADMAQKYGIEPKEG